MIKKSHLTINNFYLLPALFSAYLYMQVAECSFATRNSVSEFCPCHILDLCDLTCFISCQNLKQGHHYKNLNNRHQVYKCLTCREPGTMGRRCQVSFLHESLDGFSEKIIMWILRIQAFHWTSILCAFSVRQDSIVYILCPFCANIRTYFILLFY